MSKWARGFSSDFRQLVFRTVKVVSTRGETPAKELNQFRKEPIMLQVFLKRIVFLLLLLLVCACACVCVCVCVRTSFKGYRFPTSCKQQTGTGSSSSRRACCSLMQLDPVPSIHRRAFIILLYREFQSSV